jgi:hypothetical protein
MAKNKEVLSDEYVMAFGLYKGKSIGWIRKKDSEYLEFLRKTKGMKIN